ncbi:hypothetical protein BKA82DRAFT_643213 [Pisolithus tinctorius]|uniref:U6 snRNA phosphodiesterase 1 n=1 Tax=Pisolithus tinctorius Marx 270 TaxID=870435 RepID=A0A0C3NPF2_PISTI|nr:hypothetical protein BKA82DRAFT_643213 [Pisolithus tinctorius]KIO02750.1 hypothetical protein M404DRAFT_643213 [Pisolithus tinctorius Marx 270]
MKRTSASLVSYSSSSSDESDGTKPTRRRSCKPGPPAELAAAGPSAKRRKLPPLAASLAPPVPADDPAKHQGRIRSFPHIEGQYATYVYVPLVLGPGEALYDLVTEVISTAKKEVKGLWGVGEAEKEDAQRQKHECEDRDENKSMGRGERKNAKLELHISLSRPIFLRAHQREDFKRAVKKIAESVSPFSASFSTFSELTNDERTRTFLTMEVGAGHVEFCQILNFLVPTLRSLRQKEFYGDPKFHASIAWALLDCSRTTTPLPSTSATPDTARSSSVPLQVSQSLRVSQERPPSETVTSASGLPSQSRIPSNTPTPSDSMSTVDLDRFPRIPHLPPTLVSTLNATYAPRLSAARTGGFLADKIAVRIGKEVVVWCLSGIGQAV